LGSASLIATVCTFLEASDVDVLLQLPQLSPVSDTAWFHVLDTLLDACNLRDRLDDLLSFEWTPPSSTREMALWIEKQRRFQSALRDRINTALIDCVPDLFRDVPGGALEFVDRIFRMSSTHFRYSCEGDPCDKMILQTRLQVWRN
jgi:hypothetical protein